VGILVLLEVQVKPAAVGEFKSFMEAIFPDTRTFSGCKSAALHVNQDDATNMLAVEEWDTREDHQKYIAWRTETGIMASVAAMVAAPPSLRYFDRTNA